MATRCFIPPESCAGYAFSLPARPTSSISSSARFFASAFFQWAISIGKHTLSSILAWLSRLNCWNIMPMLRRAMLSSFSLSSRTSCPFIIMLPSSGSSSRLRHLTNVLLPAPERPITPNMSPSYTVRSTPFSAVTFFSPSAKLFVKPRTIIISFIAAPCCQNTKGAPGLCPSLRLSLFASRRQRTTTHPANCLLGIIMHMYMARISIMAASFPRSLAYIIYYLPMPVNSQLCIKCEFLFIRRLPLL